MSLCDLWVYVVVFLFVKPCCAQIPPPLPTFLPRAGGQAAVQPLGDGSPLVRVAVVRHHRVHEDRPREEAAGAGMDTGLDRVGRGSARPLPPKKLGWQSVDSGPRSASVHWRFVDWVVGGFAGENESTGCGWAAPHLLCLRAGSLSGHHSLPTAPHLLGCAQLLW